MRSLTKLTIVALAGLTFGAAAAYSQTPPAPSNCGVETWSTDKMAYVTVPCTGGGQAVSGQSGQAGAAATNSNCGIETWSTDKQMYVTTPCVGGTTYENPSASSSQNFNTK
jgi:hypothetical protein